MMHRIIEIDYTNHRGVQRIRRVLPVGQMFFGANQWHTEEQWLFNALDMDDPNEPTKTFALKGINALNSDKRISDLLTANNDLLQDNRDLKAQIAELTDQLTALQAHQATQGNGGAPALTISVDPAPVSQEPAPSAPAADASQAASAASADTQTAASAPADPIIVAEPAPEVAPAPAPQPVAAEPAAPEAPAAPIPAADPAQAPTTGAVS